jgi:hypothetical protein
LEQAVMRMHSHWHWSLLPAGVASNRLAGPALLFCCDAIPMAWRPIYGKPPWHQQLRRGLGYRQAVAGMAGACLFQWGWRVPLGCRSWILPLRFCHILVATKGHLVKLYT